MKRINVLATVMALSSAAAFADGDLFTPEAKTALEQKVMALLPSIEISKNLVLNADSLECVATESMMGNAPVGSCLTEGYDNTTPNSSGVYQITLIDREGQEPQVAVTLITSEL